MSNWLDDPDEPRAGPSFIERARRAPDDDEPMEDDIENPGLDLLGADVAEEETPFQELIRHWINERQAPDILPGQEMLLGRILDHVRKQVSSYTKRRLWQLVAGCIPPQFPGLFVGSGMLKTLALVRRRTTPSCRSRLLRGRAFPHNARPDRDRTRQVCRPLLHPHAIVQSELRTSSS